MDLSPTPLPAYFAPRPAPAPDAPTLAAFERLYEDAVAPAGGAEITYNLAAPKWQFLCHLSDTGRILMHGSGQSGIEEFEPRQSNDIREFGNRRAIYAASDGIWAIYFAVMDRDRYVRSLVNACFRVVDPDGRRHGPYYYFSINADALPHQPWRSGMIYLLPPESFEQQPPQELRGRTVEIAQWASLIPVRPLAKLSVTPSDFPFLEQIHPHDPTILSQRAAQDPGGFPWHEESR